MEPARKPVRIGFLVPPGNPTVEIEMIALAPPHVSVHFTRLTAHGAVGAPEGLEERSRMQAAHMAETVALLAMVKPKVIALAHAATSAVLGRTGEADLIARIEREHKVRFITAMGSTLAALSRLGARRIALGTPYGADATATTKAHLEENGFEVVSYGNLEGVGNIYDETRRTGARTRAPYRRAGGASDLSQRTRHADHRDDRGHGTRSRQACSLGGGRDDVACPARRGRTCADRGLRPAACDT